MAKKKQTATVKRPGRRRLGVDPNMRHTVEGKIGAHLLELFEQSGLAVAELAEILGVSEASVNQYLAGRQMPRVGKWPALAKALKLRDLNSLLPHLPIE